MNWKEFKDAVESQGITDDMELYYIDVSGNQIKSKEFDVVLNIPGGVVII